MINFVRNRFGQATSWRATLAKAIFFANVISLPLAHAQSTEHDCDAAAARAERMWNIPSGVLSAVGTVESGRTDTNYGPAPWPWTINAAGRGSYYTTKLEAIEAVLDLMRRGYPYIDVGCFQIDIMYHAGVFRSLDDAFDPELNAEAAAHILLQERLLSPDWATAVARYHSANPQFGLPYLDRVRAALPRAKMRAVEAEYTQAFLRGRSTPAGVDASGARLPIVIYVAMPPSPITQPQIVRVRPNRTTGRQASPHGSSMKP